MTHINYNPALIHPTAPHTASLPRISRAKRIPSERTTQQRIIQLFQRLGYTYLGNWEEQSSNRNIEVDILRKHLRDRGYSNDVIQKAIDELNRTTDGAQDAYATNMATYELLRYGAQVQTAPGENHDTVYFIDWKNPFNNHFAIAEEVTLCNGGHERRPDVVIYINGIAIAVLELKRADVPVQQAIYQLASNQRPEFNPTFFNTVQLLLAGNDSQGLWYGTTGTSDKNFVEWKAKHDTSQPVHRLDSPIAELFDRATLLNFLHHFVVFDGGKKKVPRHHQYIGVLAAQQRIREKRGGVIWHTQGSGKTIMMVLLAKWLLENDPLARVMLVTDRIELDKQIVGVMKSTGITDSPRIESRAELVRELGGHGHGPLRRAPHRLMCTLLHKFQPDDFKGPTPDIEGNLYVFVDECHRTQGGGMHAQMKRWLNKAIFIGFTGTPLLLGERQTTTALFGPLIHTYKMDEAEADRVVLPLRYEARHVPQRLDNPEYFETWFALKTKGLTQVAQAMLRKEWATLTNVLSAEDRKKRIVDDIAMDFATIPRLVSGKGTAILAASSIYDACQYFQLFQQSSLKGKVGLVTSYIPNGGAISSSPSAGKDQYQYDTYTKHVLADKETTEQYESRVKRQFIEEPANMKVLIVVSKLLTGFDAPSCSYIYLDHALKEHNLFQAICRTNRLDGEDKDVGHIVDYKESMAEIQRAIAVYTSEQMGVDEHGNAQSDCTISSWLDDALKRLKAKRAALHALCDLIPAPAGIKEFQDYFCGAPTDATALNDLQPLRTEFYKAVNRYTRAFADIKGYWEEAGVSAEDEKQYTADELLYRNMRDAVALTAGETLDLGAYEADMLQLLHSHIKAEPTKKMGGASQETLIDLIVHSGIHDVIAGELTAMAAVSQAAVTNAVVHNLRSVIVREQLLDPAFYANMTSQINVLLAELEAGAQSYEEFLNNVEALAKRLRAGRENVPVALRNNKAAQSIFNNIGQLPTQGRFVSPTGDADKEALALVLDESIRGETHDNWRGDSVRERNVLRTIAKHLNEDETATLALFEIIKAQPEY